jgi:DNA-directed RNA polymerase specialized sigma24 family protein
MVFQQISAVAVGVRHSRASVVHGDAAGVVAGDLGSGLSDGSNPESDCIRAQAEAIAADVVDGCLGGLTPEHHDVLVLRYWHELTFEEIGELFGIGKSGAKQLHDRALERLRDSFRLINFTASDLPV